MDISFKNEPTTPSRTDQLDNEGEQQLIRIGLIRTPQFERLPTYYPDDVQRQREAEEEFEAYQARLFDHNYNRALTHLRLPTYPAAGRFAYSMQSPHNDSDNSDDSDEPEESDSSELDNYPSGPRCPNCYHCADCYDQMSPEAKVGVIHTSIRSSADVNIIENEPGYCPNCIECSHRYNYYSSETWVTYLASLNIPNNKRTIKVL